MQGRLARVLFLAACCVLGTLALFHRITPVSTGVLFAATLVVLGVALSRAIIFPREVQKDSPPVGVLSDSILSAI
jgi:hypothetical protein